MIKTSPQSDTGSQHCIRSRTDPRRQTRGLSHRDSLRARRQRAGRRCGGAHLRGERPPAHQSPHRTCGLGGDGSDSLRRMARHRRAPGAHLLAGTAHAGGRQASRDSGYRDRRAAHGGSAHARTCATIAPAPLSIWASFPRKAKASTCVSGTKCRKIRAPMRRRFTKRCTIWIPRAWTGSLSKCRPTHRNGPAFWTGYGARRSRISVCDCCCYWSSWPSRRMRRKI